MQRYILTAEFTRWKAPDNAEPYPETMTHVVELESKEEAKLRLESMIIERMSSRPGWTYVLLNSSFTEFTDESSTTLPENHPASTHPEQLTAEKDATLLPFIADTPGQKEEEILPNTPQQEPLPLPDEDLSQSNHESDQNQD